MKEKKFKIPHVFVLLMLIVLIAAIMSYIVPAGMYDRVDVDGRSLIDAESFHYIDRTPVGLMTLLSSMSAGMEQGAAIIFFVFIVGGSIGVLQDSGAIEGGLIRLSKVLAGRETLIVPIVMIIISLASATMGASEEMMPLIPIMVALAIAVGFDSITGCAMIISSCASGFAGAFMNPFTVGVAQGIAELPPMSGAAFRVVMYICITSSSIIIISRYAQKVKKNPTLSSMYEFDLTRDGIVDEKEVNFGIREKLSLLAFVITLGILVYGVTQEGWYFTEIGALFLGMSIVVAIISNMGLDGYGTSLANGMTNVASGALVVGIATGILVVLNEGNIMDTMLHAAATLLSNLPSQVSAIGMYIFQCLLNFLVPSGSGQAAITMPILAPLGDLVGVTRQTAVICFQLGDGISNAITPTSGVLMASLALGKVPWGKWAKFYLPILLVHYAIGLVFVLVAQFMHLGPF